MISGHKASKNLKIRPNTANRKLRNDPQPVLKKLNGLYSPFAKRCWGLRAQPLQVCAFVRTNALLARIKTKRMEGTHVDQYIKMYRTRDVAKILNISTGTVLRRIADGSLKATKDGNRWAVAEPDLREYINTNKAAQSCTYNLLPSKIEDIDGLKLFTPAKIAEKMHVTEQAVRKWIKQGKIKAIKPGGRVLIPFDYFVEFVNREYTLNNFGYYKLMKAARDPNTEPENDDPPIIKT